MYFFFFFFFNDTATTEIYTLSLHDALPIYMPLKGHCHARHRSRSRPDRHRLGLLSAIPGDRKSTRLNSSHLVISYAVFCLKKKKKTTLSTSIISYYSSSITRPLYPLLPMSY